jgi:hypothetical protein
MNNDKKEAIEVAIAALVGMTFGIALWGLWNLLF